MVDVDAGDAHAAEIADVADVLQVVEEDLVRGVCLDAVGAQRAGDLLCGGFA